METENSKRKKKSSQEKKVERQKKQEVEQEVIKKVEVIREEKKKEKKKQHIQEKAKPKVILKVGDRVRLLDGKAVGTIDTIEKNKALVNYGLFTTSVGLDQLELVEAKK